MTGQELARAHHPLALRLDLHDEKDAAVAAGNGQAIAAGADHDPLQLGRVEPAEEPAAPILSSVPSPAAAPAAVPAPRSDDDNGPDDGGDAPKKAGRPTLTRIK
mgnify:CR=1 FL=1